MWRNLVAASVVAICLPLLADVECEGDYDGHLQGVASDGANLFWSFTDVLVKTDRSGHVVRKADVPRHSGDLCVRDSIIYVATNLGRFNTENEAKSSVCAYRMEDLSKVGEWPLPELIHGAGGMTFANGRFYVVGGLPKSHMKNYVYEYTEDFVFVRRHELDSGPTLLGIQTAHFSGGRFYFGCYGGIVLVAPPSLDSVGKFSAECSMGLLDWEGGLHAATSPYVARKRRRGVLKPLVIKPWEDPPVVFVRGEVDVGVATDAVASVRQAAELLTNALSRVLGKPVPIRATPDPYTASVFLGDSPMARWAGLDPSRMTRDSFGLCTVGGSVVISGRDDAGAVDAPGLSRGTFRGVREFLSWYAGVKVGDGGVLDEKTVPHSGRFSVPGCGTVCFVECPKCDKRMRMSEDGRMSFINLSRIPTDQKKAMVERAGRLLALSSARLGADEFMPLMGWASWNTFAVDISEEIILETAKAMSTNGLKKAGYVYVNIDDGFFGGRDANGSLRFHPKRFPRGMKGTVDGIHALGMKAGTYSEAGSNTCGSIWNGDALGIGSGMFAHDAADCRLFFKELGFDFIKVDYCGGLDQKLDERRRYTEIAHAVRATGVPGVRLNICRWAFPGTWAADLAESWRTTRDIRACWESVRNIISENLYLSAYASPGHYNDLDMLEVGQIKGAVTSAFKASGDTGFTEEEELTHFGMWCMLSSPLVLGCDVRNLPARTLELVTNPYLLAMNQNDLGLQGYVVSRDDEAYVIVKDADDKFGKSRYVALYNANDREHVFQVRPSVLDLGGKIQVFDLAQRADIGEFVDGFSARVPPHASRFYRFDAECRLERASYEAETAYLTEYQELNDLEKTEVPHFKEMSGASGGVVVDNLGGRETNDLIWNEVHMVRDGRRRFIIRCSSSGKGRFFIQIDDEDRMELCVEDTANGFADVELESFVHSGIHRVRLSNSKGRMPVIDCMMIREAM